MLEGVYAGIDNGFFQSEIADASYDLERGFDSGRRLVVGVNGFVSDEAPELPILEIDIDVETRQQKRLAQTRADRSGDAVEKALADLGSAAADPNTNVMPAVLDAVRAYASEGEIIETLVEVFGRYRETPVI